MAKSFWRCGRSLVRIFPHTSSAIGNYNAVYEDGIQQQPPQASPLPGVGKGHNTAKAGHVRPLDTPRKPSRTCFHSSKHVSVTPDFAFGDSGAELYICTPHSKVNANDLESFLANTPTQLQQHRRRFKRNNIDVLVESSGSRR